MACLCAWLATACSGSLGSPQAYAGHRWRLTAVTDGRTRVEVPSDWYAWIEFSTAGCFLLDDGVNAMGGKYTSGATGFTTSEVGTTLVGYVGGDPGKALIAAMGEVALGPLTSGTTGPTATTRAEVTDGSLQLSTPGYHLTLAQTGPAHVDQAPRAAGLAAGHCPG